MAEPAAAADVRRLRTVAQVLTQLPKKLDRPMMIPLGSHAFIPGRIRHTNEVFVKLDDYYVQTSVHCARQSIARRVQRIESAHSCPPSKPVRDGVPSFIKQRPVDVAVPVSAEAADDAPPPGIPSSTVVHRTSDGTVHILEFPEPQVVERALERGPDLLPGTVTGVGGIAAATAESISCTPAAALFSADIDNRAPARPTLCHTADRSRTADVGERPCDGPTPVESLPTEAISARSRAGSGEGGQVRSELHHNADGTITILEFPDDEESSPVKATQPPHAVEPPVATLAGQVASLRTRGNAAFQRNHFAAAADLYSQCIDVIRNARETQAPGARDVQPQLHVLLTNRAATHLAQNKFALVVADATAAIAENAG